MQLSVAAYLARARFPFLSSCYRFVIERRTVNNVYFWVLARIFFIDAQICLICLDFRNFLRNASILSAPFSFFFFFDNF